MPANPPHLSLSITNPLVLYRTLVATKKIKPDPAQHRLALRLQKLYFRLKDYAPEIEYRYRLEKIGRRVAGARQRSASTVETGGRRNGAQQRQATPDEDGDHVHVHDDEGDGSPRRAQRTKRSMFPSLWSLKSLPSTTLALIRAPPLHHSALSINSPMGMLLYGEVGRGKSMLLDLLYGSLPSRMKRRWHFNTFMLDIFRRIELARIERLESTVSSSQKDLFGRDGGPGISDHEHVILSLAKDTISDSPILFLDEFQMPDRASSKLINGFFTAFFHLGGVLVASSNRMPEELSKAAGIEFGDLRRTNSPRGGAGGAGGFFGLGWGLGRESEGERAAKTDFGMFLEVLRARCEVWEMEGEKDWRREGDDYLDLGEASLDVDVDKIQAQVGVDADEPGDMENLDTKTSVTTENTSVSSVNALSEPTTLSSDAPAHYHINLPSSPSDPSFENDLHILNPSSTWNLVTLTIYGRQLELPYARDGVLKSNFAALCATYLGPADYVSLCSTFHTIVLTDVPVLTLAQKNEARRFITLLDALYEARCRLLIQAAAPPDKLFFPETRVRRASAVSASASAGHDGAGDGGGHPGDGGSSESITSESFSEMYQDSTAPFRPNISSYTEANTRSSIPPSHLAFTSSLQNPSVRTVLADEDADFGPTYGNGRGHGISNSTTARWDVGPVSAGPDFTSTSVLTGEDERFAYKRARSRLWEMCGRKWWDERLPVTQRVDDDDGDEDHGQNGSGESRADAGKEDAVPTWWRPVHRSGRFWEPAAGRSNDVATAQPSAGTTATTKTKTTTITAQTNRDHSASAPAPAPASTARAPMAPQTKNDTDPKLDAMFRHDASPYRRHADPPPKFGWQHAWGMMRWGKRAGEWGKGVDGKRTRKRGPEAAGSREK